MRWYLALVVCAGCYAPNVQPGVPCADGVCPDGLICSPATDTCELRAIDAGTPSDDAPDAPRDAAFDAAPDAAPATAVLIQQATTYAGSAASLSATLIAPPASGNVLVMIGATPSGGLTSVTGGGATWTRAAASLINMNVEVWYGVTDGSSSTVTISRTNNTTRMWLAVSEWSGLAPTATLDVASDNDGLGSGTISAGSITTTNARDLVVFAAASFTPNTFGAPAPGTWTAMTPIDTTGASQGAWYRVISATATLSPTVSHTGGDWDAALVGFRLAP